MNECDSITVKLNRMGEDDMANTSQADKRARQAEARRIKRKGQMTRVRTLKKNILQSVQSNQLPEAQAYFKAFQKALGPAVRKNLLHKNTASRWLSRMNSHIKAIAFKKAS